mmetsp:Transcript_28821/g.73037  ORF Transcript_28821/g.73037 Transcript_28821/m.73037 type:complete len:547 (+) Transcript_28821:3454-5094(+)
MAELGQHPLDRPLAPLPEGDLVDELALHGLLLLVLALSHALHDVELVGPPERALRSLEVDDLTLRLVGQHGVALVCAADGDHDGVDLHVRDHELRGEWELAHLLVPEGVQPGDVPRHALDHLGLDAQVLELRAEEVRDFLVGDVLLAEAVELHHELAPALLRALAGPVVGLPGAWRRALRQRGSHRAPLDHALVPELADPRLARVLEGTAVRPPIAQLLALGHSAVDAGRAHGHAAAQHEAVQHPVGPAVDHRRPLDHVLVLRQVLRHARRLAAGGAAASAHAELVLRQLQRRRQEALEPLAGQRRRRDDEVADGGPREGVIEGGLADLALQRLDHPRALQALLHLARALAGLLPVRVLPVDGRVHQDVSVVVVVATAPRDLADRDGDCRGGRVSAGLQGNAFRRPLLQVLDEAIVHALLVPLVLDSERDRKSSRGLLVLPKLHPAVLAERDRADRLHLRVLRALLQVGDLAGRRRHLLRADLLHGHAELAAPPLGDRDALPRVLLDPVPRPHGHVVAVVERVHGELHAARVELGEHQSEVEGACG